MRNIENLPDIPRQLRTNFFLELFKSAEIANFAPAERLKYRKDMMDEQSIAMTKKYHERIGREKGLEEGREEGREEGLKESRTQIARAMLLDGQPAETVSKYTGLSAGEIKALAI